MVREGRACDACTRNCAVIHQKQKDCSPLVTRFWKPVLNEECSNVLYLPPKFARRAKLVDGYETQIEDSNGQRWSVTLSYVERSLAFKEGWKKFYMDHGLKTGDLLLFSYMKGSHFIVQIYGKSSCERTNFNKENSRERKKLKRDSGKVSIDKPLLNTSQERKRLKIDSRKVSVDEPFLSVASGSKCQNRQTHQVEANANLMRPVPMDMEDPTCLINRDDEYHRRADRNVLFDLSSFEMRKETFETNNSREALKMQLMPFLDETTEQEAKVDDIQMDATRTYEIDSHFDDVLADKSEKAVDSIIAPPHNEKVAVMDVDKTAEVLTDESEKVVETKIAPSHTEKVAMDRVVEVEDTKIAPPRTQNVAMEDVIRNAEVFLDKVEEVVNTKTVPPHSEIKEQMKTKRDGTDMSALGPTPVANRSADLFTDKSRLKPFDSINLSKKAIYNNSNSRSGNNNVLQTNSGTPSISGKIGERKYLLRSRYPEATVTRSMVTGKISIKKEPVELEEKVNRIAGVSSDAGTEPTSLGKRAHPVVKAEPDLPYDMFPSDAVMQFSAKVKSQNYLELPVNLPSTPGRRRMNGTGMIVYLKDPVQRIWPLLYCGVFPVRALTSNWRIFCEKNRIKPGDECRFQAENKKNSLYRLYRVDFVRSFGGSG